MKKTRTYRNADYMKFLRDERPCIVTLQGSPHVEMVSHHVRIGGNGGMGLKPSDYRCVPLTAQEHVRLHNQGETFYWKEKGIDPNHYMVGYLSHYLATFAVRKNLSHLAIPLLEDIIETLRSFGERG